MNILHLSTFDRHGGAAVAANRLHQALLRVGVESRMLVGHRQSDDSTVAPVSTSAFYARQTLAKLAIDKLHFSFFQKSKAVRWQFDTALTGFDVSRHPLIQQADILHLHWTNQAFLSLSDLEKLARLGKPIVWTMHDMWAFTGGCHHSRGCENFTVGCGNCEPYLRNPAPNDLSAQRLARKLNALAVCSILHGTTPSRWLSDLARRSVLFNGRSVHTIPNLIPDHFFTDTNPSGTPSRLNLPTDKLLISTGSVKVADERKGYSLLPQIIGKLLEHQPQLREKIALVIMGGKKNSVPFDLPIPVYYSDFITDPTLLADYYRASHVFFSASLEESFGLTLAEAMACGTPAVAFRVGGIPDIIDHQQNGYLAEYRSVTDLAAGLAWVLLEADKAVLRQEARKKIKSCFSEAVVLAQHKQLYDRLV